MTTAVAGPRVRRRMKSQQCGSKIRYLSQMLARNAAILHAWAGRPGMSAYCCPHCADWHVGHQPGSSRNRAGGGPVTMKVAIITDEMQIVVEEDAAAYSPDVMLDLSHRAVETFRDAYALLPTDDEADQ